MRKRGRRGQSEVIGVILLLGLTVIGVTAIAAIGATNVADSRHAAEIQSTEHAMTLFDSRAATVALGDADVQAVRFGRTGGQFDVRESGTMRITHRDEGGEEIWSSDPIPLGAVVYTNGETEIVYEGGGVWRHEDGATVMVSPPEFHYQRETLTLPIVTVAGEGSASGGSELFVFEPEGAETKLIYPTETNVNPIDRGEVIVTVESEYHEGWEQYFETRTNGEIELENSECTSSECAEVKLRAHETIGEFTMTGNGDELNLRLAEEEENPLEEFRLTLYPNDPGSGESGREFSPFQWGFEVSESDFELMFRKNGDYVDVLLTSPDGSETWEGEEAFAIGTNENDDEYVHLRLVDPETAGIELTNGTETRTLDDLLGEYLLELGPKVDLKVFDQGQGGGGGSDRVDYETSFGYLEYDGSDQFIAYLHITENEVSIRFS